MQAPPRPAVHIKNPIIRNTHTEFPGLRLRLKHDCYRTQRKVLLSVSSRFSISESQQPEMPDSQNVAAILFANGSDCGLWPLTRRRAAGAIPLGANYRLIDVVVSNCIHSNINKVYALTQYNSTSLNAHLTRAYLNAGLGKEGFVQVLAACQSPESQRWFQGNADAVRSFLWLLQEHPVKEFLILPGYHLYKMDYQDILRLHHERKADITISAFPEMRIDRGFGVLKLNTENEVIGVLQNDTSVPEFGRLQGSKDDDNASFASMGIYVISKDVMIKVLREYLPWANDFGSEVIPGAISLGMKVQAYMFDGFWENMGSIKTFYEANMESIKKTDIKYDFFDRDYPLHTKPRCLPPTRIAEALIVDSVIGDGCILNSCSIKRSVLGLRTRIEDGVLIEDSIIMGSDIYQDDLQLREMDATNLIIPIGIGEGSVIRKAIVDKNARVGKKVMITNKDNVLEGNREDQGFVIIDGIMIVMRSALIPDGSIM